MAYLLFSRHFSRVSTPIRAARRIALSICGLLLVGAAPEPSDGQIHGKVTEIFKRPEFRTEPTFDIPHWLAERFARFFRWLGELHETNQALYWFLVITCILLLSLLLAHIVWNVRRAFYLTAEGSKEGEHAAERVRMSGSCREEALRRAAAGDYTEAIRYLFLSLVYAFDEKGRVSFQQAYTNREYLALFHDRPQVHDELKEFVDTLDQHWYGQHPTDQRRYENCLALYESLK